MLIYIGAMGENYEAYLTKSGKNTPIINANIILIDQANLLLLNTMYSM